MDAERIVALTALLVRANAARRGGGGADWLRGVEEALAAVFAPARWLAAYGTLAPGGPNHGEVAGLGGTWSTGVVHGRRARREHPVFTFDPAAPPVPVHLLCSAGLAAAWPRLDAFEGPAYRRILVPVLAGGRLAAVANLYEATTPVGS